MEKKKRLQLAKIDINGQIIKKVPIKPKTFLEKN